MRKFAKILIPAFLLIAVVMSMSILSVSAAPEEVTFEWTGSTQTEAITFLNNAMAEAEAGKEVKVVLKNNMSFSSSAARTKIDFGTDATTDTTVVISGEATGDTYYGITVDANTILNFKGNVAFKNVALTGTGAWSSGSTIIVSEGAGTFGVNDAANGYGNVKASKVNVAGRDIKIYTGSYSTVAGNMYKSGVTIDSPTIVLAGNSSANSVIGRQQDCGGGDFATGDSNVSILDQASVTSEVTAGNRQSSATKGGGTLNLNTTGTVKVVYLATSNTSQDCNFAKADETRSTYTLNVLGGSVSGCIYLYTSQTGTAKNLNAVFNFGNAEYKNMIWTGVYKQAHADWGNAITNCNVEVNVTGGTFANYIYMGSRYEYASAKDTGSYENINRTINISGNPTFKELFVCGDYAVHGSNTHRGATTVNISGGTFEKEFCGGSRLRTAADGHTGKIDINVTGGTFKGIFYGGSYVQYGATPHKGDINVNISGGTFNTFVLGGSNMYVESSEHTGNVKMTLSGGTFKNHVFAGSYLRKANTKHSGTSTLEIAGAIKHTGGRIGAGSIITANAVHSGAANLILSSNATGSFATQILAGSYLDKGAHTGDSTVTISGSADWNQVYGGSFVGNVANPVGAEGTPVTIDVVVEDTYKGEITKLVAGNMYNGANPKNTTTYANANVTIKGGEVGAVYGHDVLHYAENKVVGETKINIVGGRVLAVYGLSKLDNGAKVDINITDGAERVVAVKGSGDANVTPANVTVTYDRKVIRDDEISGIKAENITAKGDKADQPDKYMPTVYISANGTGDGSSPDKPLGNAAGYDPLAYKADKTSDAYKSNAFYRAMQELSAMGGRIVLVGPVSIDTAASRIESTGKNQSPSEFFLPSVGGEVIITSTYNGVDYAATNGAKLILDQDKCNVTFLEINCPVTFEKLTIEHKYDATDKNSWGTPFAIAVCGNKLVVEDTVKVTAVNAKTGAAGDWYPMILGGKRYTSTKNGVDQPLVANPDITIKAGNWDSVYAGCYGMGSTYPGNIDGNATVNVEGGYVGTIFGTTSTKYASGKITGKLEINVTGGTVDAIYAAQKNGASNEIVVNIAATAERVRRAYGGTSDSNIPANATINYARKVIRDDEIFYWANTNASGSLADQPEKYMPTVYISANGTGDGSSPDKPLGNAPGYDPFAFNEKKTSDAYKSNALYRAIEQLYTMGGRIVLVGPVSIDTAASRIESTGKGQSPSEFTLPVANGEVVITSTFGGVDYAAKNGAKLILDQDKCCVTFLEFQCPVTFDKLTIEHRYDPNDTNAWDTPFAIAARGNKLVVEDTVKVTAWNTAKNMAGNWYPMILGGSRFTTFKSNTDVTIKAGNWSAVYAGSFGMGTSYPGNIEGNATVNIMGGKVDTVFGTTDSKYACGKITGKLEINVTGGYVGAIFATQKNGAANEIVVNIAATAERVAKVWGGVSDASVPTNGTVNYDRSVTRDDEVKYWTTVNATGNVEDQPEPVYFTLYVSNVEKGLGDGSSPENAIGHAEGYAKLRAQALAIIKANGGTNSGLTDAQKAITGSVYKQNALYRALSYGGGKLVKQGGKLVVCGTLNVDATDAMRKSLADFWGPTGSAEVIITSYDGKTNYRAKGAKLVLDNSELGLCVELGSPTTFDNITIEHKYNSKNGKGISNGAIIAGRGNKLVFGYNVKVIATDVNPDEEARIEMYPTIVGGHRYSDSKSDCYVTVGSGQWAALVGGDFGSPHTGNATIGINGGKIGTICGTINPTNGTKKNIFNGSVWIGLWAGEVDNVYVVGKPGMIWGDASIGLGGTVINGKVRAVHPDYEGDEIQSWVFNYTDKQVDTKKVVGFENPVPATGSALPYLAVVATVSLVGAAALIVSKKKKAVKN